MGYVSLKVNPQYRSTFGQPILVPEEHPYMEPDADLVVLPSSYEDPNTGLVYVVTSIEDFGFANCPVLQRVQMPQQITTIGKGAFANCPELNEVKSEFSYLLTTIGDSAFAGCSQLRYVLIDGDVVLKKIGNRAFYQTGLYTFSLPADASSILDTIGVEAFAYNRDLSNVSLPQGLKYIGNNAFFSCTSLGSISIPNSVTYLGSSAFRYCTSLNSVDMNGGNINNTIIRNYTFANTSISQFLVPAPIQEIGIGAFKDCGVFSDLQFSSTNTLTTIQRSAFQGTAVRNNTSLSLQNRHWLKLPTSVKIIGDSAFKDCLDLTWMHNPGEDATYFYNLTRIGKYAFAGSGICNFDLSRNDSVFTIGEGAFSDCARLGDIHIGNLQILEDRTFENCTAVSFRVSSNNKVKSIRRWVFKNTSLTSIDLSQWTLLDSIGYDAFHSNSKLTTVVLPSNLKHIEYGCFANDTALTTINIPEGIKGIRGYTFYLNKNLKRITLPSTIEFIDKNAFEQTGLQHISIPNRVTKIGYKAFYKCENLVSVLLRPNIQTIDSLAFSDSPRLAVINCLAGTPPAFDSVSINSTFKNVTLEDITCIVPAVSLSRYKATGWGRMMLEPYQEENEIQFLAGEWNFIAGTGKQTGFLNFNNVSAYNNAALSFPVYTSTQQGEINATDYRNLDYVALDFDYATNGWKNSGMHRTHNMTEGAGYLVWMYTSNAKGTEVTSNGAITRLSNYLKTDGNVSYTTDPNSGQQALPNINSGYWYSFGNPFNKYVGVSHAIASIRNGQNTQPIVQGSKVYVYDNKGWVEKTYGDLMPGQGFMVATSTANLPLTFAMNYPTTTYLPSNIASSLENEGIKFSLTANGLTSNLYAKQMSEAQDGFDINDAYILFSLNEEQIEPYFVVDNNAVKYNRYNSDNYSCKINIHANNSAQASMSVSDVPAGTTVSIVDLATNAETVLEDNVFEFDVHQGENSDRYLIKIVKNGASSLNQVGNTKANISIWNNNEEIFVKGENLQRVEIYNTLGQMVYQREVSGEAYNFTFDNEGAYVVKAICSNGTKSQKVIIK